MPATLHQAFIASDLADAAHLITERGLWTGNYAFADPAGTALDPTAALWIAVHGTLPFTFATAAPGFAEQATEMALTEPRVLAALTYLAEHITSPVIDSDPVERIADWVSRTPEVEVVGRMLRLAQQLTTPAAQAA